MTTIVAISDTHSMHRRIKVPEADILIHAGDFCGRGNRAEIEDLADWLRGLPHAHKIIVAGNHDRYAEDQPEKTRKILEDAAGAIFLLDESVTIDGIKFWGSPVTPRFGGWHFMMDRGPELVRHWAQIPDDTDIVITHGPAFGLGDVAPDYHGETNGKAAGCIDLLNRLREIKNTSGFTYPRVHVFGHIHNGHGVYSSDEFGNMKFVNAAICTESYEPINQPIVFGVDALSGRG